MINAIPGVLTLRVCVWNYVLVCTCGSSIMILLWYTMCVSLKVFVYKWIRKCSCVCLTLCSCYLRAGLCVSNTSQHVREQHVSDASFLFRSQKTTLCFVCHPPRLCQFGVKDVYKEIWLTDWPADRLTNQPVSPSVLHASCFTCSL